LSHIGMLSHLCGFAEILIDCAPVAFQNAGNNSISDGI